MTKSSKIGAALLCFISLQIKADINSIDVEQACSYFGEAMSGSVYAFGSGNDAERIISEIVAVSGLPQNFSVSSASVPDAAAVIHNEQERWVLYNINFMQEMEEKTGSQWAAYSIMAHEIGHHLSGHTLTGLGSRPKTELEADKYSGFIMNRLGATLKEAQMTMQIVGTENESSTHPAKRDRLAAIASGWIEECDRNSKCGRKAGDTSLPSDVKSEKESATVRREYRLLAVILPNEQYKRMGCVGAAGEVNIDVNENMSGSIVTSYGIPVNITGRLDGFGNVGQGKILGALIAGRISGNFNENTASGEWATGDGCKGTWVANNKYASTSENVELADSNLEKSLTRADKMLVQRTLNDGGFAAGKVDGVFGKKTRQSIGDWQASKGLPVTGTLDFETFYHFRSNDMNR